MGTESELGALARRQHGAFSRRQLVGLGVSDDAIGSKLRSGSWVRLTSGVYAVAGAPASWHRQLWAAFLSRPDALVGGRSAAVLLGFPGVGKTRPELLLPFEGNARSDLARVVRSRHYELVNSRVVAGFRVTTPAETLLTLSLSHSTAAIERWVDALLLEEKLSVSDFDPIMARLTYARMRGLKGLRRIVAERDHDAYEPPQSDLERMLYRVLDRPEVPRYVRQAAVDLGPRVARVDALIDDWKLVVEADGRRWHARTGDFERDRERDNAAMAQGLKVVRFTYRMLKNDPDSCVRTLIAVGRQP